MNHNTLPASVNGMGLDLRDIVSDIIDNRKVYVRPENAFKGSPNRVADNLAVRPCEVRGCRHRLKIALSFGRMDWGACQLPVWQMEAVPPHSLIHQRNVI